VSPAPGLQISIVLPTFCEAESLPIVVPRICAALEAAGLQGEVIVVDDDSPDGTGDVARELGETYPVRVLSRHGERGLATAALAGFGASDAPVVVVMDADGSHPVERLDDLVRPVLDDAADVVVGSRRIPGGSAEHWPWHRRWASRVAGLLSRGLTDLSDPTSGFMAVRRALLAELDLDPVGWKIVLEVAFKARGARLREVPIVFSDRQLGESKLDWSVQFDFLRHLIRLHRFRARQRRVR
jgi:dolichol-phosphate mannosyltransferase